MRQILFAFLAITLIAVPSQALAQDGEWVYVPAKKDDKKKAKKADPKKTPLSEEKFDAFAAAVMGRFDQSDQLQLQNRALIVQGFKTLEGQGNAILGELSTVKGNQGIIIGNQAKTDAKVDGLTGAFMDWTQRQEPVVVIHQPPPPARIQFVMPACDPCGYCICPSNRTVYGCYPGNICCPMAGCYETWVAQCSSYTCRTPCWHRGGYNYVYSRVRVTTMPAWCGY
ncbi:MAG: hypothetical protein HOO67_03265 [Candidatus Peribacteraceae bacterium]|nr:hypothetical protein [Candidatus Peribacteraceae bacterium]